MSRRLTGPNKVAAIILALGEEDAAPLFDRMHEDEIRDISAAMASLGPMASAEVEAVLAEFCETIGQPGKIFGSLASTERMLLKTLPADQVKHIMEDLSGPAGRTMWEKLGNVNEAVLANYLKNEYPQTVAVVISKIRPEHAARVLSLLPERLAMEVVMRMLRMENVQKEALEGVERTLKAEFMSNLARTQRRDSHEIMAEIFNNLDRVSEGRIMASLEERNRDSAERIRSLMFTFEDLRRLGGPAIGTLLRAFDSQKLLLALKGASPELRELFLSNMTGRASKLMRDDLAGMGPVRLKDVDEAQAALVLAAKELAAQGQITLVEGRNEEMIE